MSKAASKGTSGHGGGRREARAGLLADALRENLLKRKAQTRARGADARSGEAKGATAGKDDGGNTR